MQWEQGFFVVWDGEQVLSKHDHHHSAIFKARALIEQHPDKTFWVLSAKNRYETSLHDGKELQEPMIAGEQVAAQYEALGGGDQRIFREMLKLEKQP